MGGFTNYVRGWMGRGHAGHWGYACTGSESALPGEELALGGPEDVDDAYQLFGDGKLVGTFGKFAGGRPSFTIPSP
jgi:hypothetical protein